MKCNKCDFKEDGYRGPTWAYPCMAGYSGPKKEDVKCEGKDSCFRQLMINGNEVHGFGGCFDSKKIACVEEVTKAKFDDGTGCIPETTVDPLISKDLKEKCGLVVRAPGSRRKRDASDAASSEPKGYVCVCSGSGCNNIGGPGPRSVTEEEKNGASKFCEVGGILIGLVGLAQALL